MPSKKQLDNNKDVTNFSPTLGGYYNDSTLNDVATIGLWWGSETYNNARRYYLDYHDSSLSVNNYSRRYNGFYIRCVSEEKTVTDLIYLQDMTGEIANNTLDGTTASLMDRKSPQTRYLQPRCSFILQ